MKLVSVQDWNFWVRYEVGFSSGLEFSGWVSSRFQFRIGIFQLGMKSVLVRDWNFWVGYEVSFILGLEFLGRV